MLRAFKYRLEPNGNQARELGITLETHRRLYNRCLEQRKFAYESEKKSVTYPAQSKWFKAVRSEVISGVNSNCRRTGVRRDEQARGIMIKHTQRPCAISRAAQGAAGVGSATIGL